MAATQQSKMDVEPKHIDLNGRVFEVPDFTMKQIHDAIPAHCFKPSVIRSMAYVVRDYFYFAVLVWASTTYIPMFNNVFVRAALWAAYTVLQGMVMTGIWILAHECGHGAFTRNKQLNNVMGLIMHSFLLVPFHSWRITHSAHHKATGNIDKDTAFVPWHKEQYVEKKVGKQAESDHIGFSHLSEDAPLVTLFNCLIHQLLGWPGYLFLNLSGQELDVGFPKSSHFYFGEDSPFFKKEQLGQIIQSDIGVGLMVALVGYCMKQFGVWNITVLYLIPYLWVNHWIVAITFLQHTDASLPHYKNHAWSFARGATATIDRDFGFIDTHLFHDIIGTHVCHHLISTIPFYHAGEASVAIRKVMGQHYRADTATPFMTAFWKNQRSCQFVEESVPGSGIYFFRNLHGTGVSPRVHDDDAVEKQLQSEAADDFVETPKAITSAMSTGSAAKRRLSQTAKTMLPLVAEVQA